jgi:hypothetical protein
MSACKKCGAEVIWKQKPGGGFNPPENPDGTRHKCDGTGVAKPAKKAEPPAPKLSSFSAPKASVESQDIQAEYVRKEQTHVFLKDCVGDEKDFRADLEVIKMLSKADGPVQPGKKYKFRLIKQRVALEKGYGDEWVVSRVGTFEESFGEKPFKTGNDILKENLESKQAETAKSEAALAQIKKEEAEAAARAQENQEYLKTLTEGQKPMPAPEPTTTPEKSQQNESVTLPEAPDTTGPGKECPVELKIHLDCGSYSNIDISLPGLPIDQAIAKIESDAMKSIALMHRLMAEAKKGF